MDRSPLPSAGEGADSARPHRALSAHAAWTKRGEREARAVPLNVSAVGTLVESARKPRPSGPSQPQPIAKCQPPSARPRTSSCIAAWSMIHSSASTIAAAAPMPQTMATETQNSPELPSTTTSTPKIANTAASIGPRGARSAA